MRTQDTRTKRNVMIVVTFYAIRGGTSDPMKGSNRNYAAKNRIKQNSTLILTFNVRNMQPIFVILRYVSNLTIATIVTASVACDRHMAVILAP